MKIPVTPRQAEVCRLRWGEKKTMAQIAEEMGISQQRVLRVLNTVRSRVLAMLEPTADPRGGAPR